jgi:competence protein ComEC
VTVKKFKKYPAVYTLFPFAAGILISYLFKINFFFSDSVLNISIQAVFAFLIIFLYIKLEKFSIKIFILYSALLFGFGFLRFDFVYNRTTEENIAGLVEKFKDAELTVSGTVIEQPDVKDERVRMIVKTDSVKKGENTFIVNGNIQAVVYKNRFRESAPKKISYGDFIQLSGKLEALPHRRNPGEFDYGEYLKLHGIDASFISFGFENIHPITNIELSYYKSSIIYPVKSYSIKIIDKLIGGEEGEYLKGLVIGERSNISKEAKEEFTNAGVSHIIAVSGLNVAYVIIIIGGLLLLIPVNRTYKIFITIIFLVFYMNLTGNVPSIIRATIMASVFLLSQLFERKAISYNIIAFSAIVILLINPQQLFDAGFILSYSAILSIVYFYPKLNTVIVMSGLYNRLNKSNNFHKLVKLVITLVLGTLAAQIGTLPVTALMFKKISVISLAANIIAIPLSNIALAIGFIMLIFSTFSIWLAEIFAAAASFLLYWLLEFISLSANPDFSFIETYWADWILAVMYYSLILILFAAKKENIIPRLTIGVLIIANFIVIRSNLNENRKVTLSYLDVGNSNSCLITSPDGTNILVNAGTSSVKYTSAERNVIPYLKGRGVKFLDMLLIASLNKDEFRNLIHLVNNYPVNKIIVPLHYKPVFETDEFKNNFASKNIDYIESSKLISDFSEMRFYLVYDNKFVNGSSMLAHFIYGNELFTFSDTKDIYEENLYSRINLNDKTSVLKIPASGSFNFTSAEYIVKSNPDNIIISASRNVKRLNSDIFSETMKRTGINVLSINETGAVIFETDGLETERVR